MDDAVTEAIVERAHSAPAAANRPLDARHYLPSREVLVGDHRIAEGAAESEVDGFGSRPRNRRLEERIRPWPRCEDRAGRRSLLKQELVRPARNERIKAELE